MNLWFCNTRKSLFLLVNFSWRIRSYWLIFLKFYFSLSLWGLWQQYHRCESNQCHRALIETRILFYRPKYYWSDFFLELAFKAKLDLIKALIRSIEVVLVEEPSCTLWMGAGKLPMQCLQLFTRLESRLINHMK